MRRNPTAQVPALLSQTRSVTAFQIMGWYVQTGQLPRTPDDALLKMLRTESSLSQPHLVFLGAQNFLPADVSAKHLLCALVADVISGTQLFSELRQFAGADKFAVLLSSVVTVSLPAPNVSASATAFEGTLLDCIVVMFSIVAQDAARRGRAFTSEEHRQLQRLHGFAYLILQALPNAVAVHTVARGTDNDVDDLGGPIALLFCMCPAEIPQQHATVAGFYELLLAAAWNSLGSSNNFARLFEFSATGGDGQPVHRTAFAEALMFQDALTSVRTCGNIVFALQQLQRFAGDDDNHKLERIVDDFVDTLCAIPWNGVADDDVVRVVRVYEAVGSVAALAHLLRIVSATGQLLTPTQDHVGRLLRSCSFRDLRDALNIAPISNLLTTSADIRTAVLARNETGVNELPCVMKYKEQQQQQERERREQQLQTHARQIDDELQMNKERTSVGLLVYAAEVCLRFGPSGCRAALDDDVKGRPAALCPSLPADADDLLLHFDVATFSVADLVTEVRNMALGDAVDDGHRTLAVLLHRPENDFSCDSQTMMQPVECFEAGRRDFALRAVGLQRRGECLVDAGDAGIFFVSGGGDAATAVKVGDFWQDVRRNEFLKRHCTWLVYEVDGVCRERNSGAAAAAAAKQQQQGGGEQDDSNTMMMMGGGSHDRQLQQGNDDDDDAVSSNDEQGDDDGDPFRAPKPKAKKKKQQQQQKQNSSLLPSFVDGFRPLLNNRSNIISLFGTVWPRFQQQLVDAGGSIEVIRLKLLCALADEAKMRARDAALAAGEEKQSTRRQRD